MKHILAGCGTPQPAPGTWGIPNPPGDAPVCPHHPLLAWDTSSCPCSSKVPVAAPSHGAQWGADPNCRPCDFPKSGPGFHCPREMALG